MRLRSHSTRGKRFGPGRPVLRIVGATAAQLILATPLAAQAHTGAIQGNVIDATGRPLSGVEASLSNTSLHATSDSAGVFLLGDIPPGRYALVLRRVGYERLQFTASIFADDTIRSPMTMHASARQLDTVVTKARQPTTDEATDFDLIRKSGVGIIFDSTEIAQHSGDRVSDLLRFKASGITYKQRSGCGGLALAAGNGVGLPVDMKGSKQLGHGMCTAPDACYYQVYVDGMRVYSYDRSTVPPNIDDIADASLIHGIEVYTSGARTPAQYNSTGAACGTIVFWLKR